MQAKINVGDRMREDQARRSVCSAGDPQELAQKQRCSHQEELQPSQILRGRASGSKKQMINNLSIFYNELSGLDLQLQYNQQVATMKSAMMRPPAISEIFNQKLAYQNHLKKLGKIRQERRSQLQADHGRLTQIQHIKDSRSRSFAHRFNEQNLQINQSNVKLLVKLERAQPFTRYTSYSASERIPPPREQSASFLKPATRKKVVETEKENSRIYFKMKAVSSTLSRDRMLSDYAKAQKIRDRITKYATDHDRVALKSEKYFNHNRSSDSARSLNASTDRLKKSLVSHYRKEDILRNRVEPDKRLTNRRARGLPSLGNQKATVQEHNYDYVQEKVEDKTAFFATEPAKDKRRAATQIRKQK